MTCLRSILATDKKCSSVPIKTQEIIDINIKKNIYNKMKANSCTWKLC